MKTIAFVVPWYGDNIPGGAEMLLRGLTSHLKEAGVSIEILTTCVKEFSSDWSVNFHKEGVTTNAFGIPVRRFKARKRNTSAFDKVNAKLIAGEHVSLTEEKIFLQEMINSRGLYAYMKKHKDDYSLFVFTPYMFGTTFYGAQIVSEKAVLIPCFHDEAYFYFEEFKRVFSNVGGIIYNAYPEKVLAEKNMNLSNVYQAVLGTGVETSISGDAARFKEKYKIEDPYIIYAGRKDSGKNVDTLVKYFTEYLLRKRSAGIDSKLKLILIGGGSIDIPEEFSKDVIDLGFVPIEDKYDAMAGAEFLCQPSKNESFSIVIMESWLCGRPVLVNEKCPVTADFAVRTSGGLYFKDFGDFEGCTDYFLSNPDVAIQMGKNGDKFVRENFDWKTVTSRTIDFLKEVEQKNE